MKKLIIGFVVAMAATFSQASYLYWQVTDSTLNSGTFNSNTITGYRVVALNSAYDYTPGVAEGHSALTTSYANDTGTGWDTGTTVAPYVATGGNAYANLSTYEKGYTYYIEIMGYGNLGTSGSPVVIGVSEGLSYADAVSQGRLTDGLSDMASSVKAWTGGSYAAPEPTSGLLLLVGGALLALRRRRA